MSTPHPGRPGPWTLETIIGPLLSTRTDPLRAEITFTEHDRPTRPTHHRVWLGVKDVYRHEQPPAPTVLQHRTGSSLVHRDGTVDRGPRISAGGHSPGAVVLVLAAGWQLQRTTRAESPVTATIDRR